MGKKKKKSSNSCLVAAAHLNGVQAFQTVPPLFCGEGDPLHLFILPAWLLQVNMFAIPYPSELIRYTSTASLRWGSGWGVS